MVGYGENGSVVGPQNLPTSSVASGVWSLAEYSEGQRDGIWPAPTVGWLGLFNASFYSGATYYNGSCCDDQNNVFLTTYGTMSTGSQGGSVSRVTSDGVMTNTMYQTSPSGSGAFSIRDVVFDAGGNSLYAFGSQYQNASGANNRVGIAKFNEGLTSLNYQINNNSPSQFQDFYNIRQNSISVGTNYFLSLGSEYNSSGNKTILFNGNKSDGSRYGSPREFIDVTNGSGLDSVACVMAPSQVGYGLTNQTGLVYMFRGSTDLGGGSTDAAKWKRTDSQRLEPWDMKNKGTNEQIIAGGYGTNNSSTSRVFIMVINTTSKVISWQKQISLQSSPTSPNEASSYRPSIATDSSENVYVGWSEKINSGNYTGNVVKYNSSGTLQWVRSLRCTSSAVSFSFEPSVSVSSDDAFIYLYLQDSTTAGGQAFLLQLTAAGSGVGSTMTLGGHSFILEAPSHQNAAGVMDSYQSSYPIYNQGGSTAVATASNGFTANATNYVTKVEY